MRRRIVIFSFPPFSGRSRVPILMNTVILKVIPDTFKMKVKTFNFS